MDGWGKVVSADIASAILDVLDSHLAISHFSGKTQVFCSSYVTSSRSHRCFEKPTASAIVPEICVQDPEIFPWCLAEAKANGKLAVMHKMFRDVPFHIAHSALVRPRLEHGVQFWPPLYKKAVDRLERVQRGSREGPERRGSREGHKAYRRTGKLPCEGRLRELALLALTKEGLGEALSPCSSS